MQFLEKFVKSFDTIQVFETSRRKSLRKYREKLQVEKSNNSTLD